MAPEAERYLDLIPAAFRQRVAVAFAEQREAGLREGCYALFFPFTRDPTHCVRAAVSVYRRNGLTLFSRITRMRLPGRRRRYAPQQRHDGVVIAAPASLQFVANDRHGFRDISLARFEAPAQSSRGLLNGLAMGLGTESPPMSMRVALEYLGSAGLERQMLERSGLSRSTARMCRSSSAWLSGWHPAGFPIFLPSTPPRVSRLREIAPVNRGVGLTGRGRRVERAQGQEGLDDLARAAARSVSWSSSGAPRSGLSCRRASSRTCCARVRRRYTV